MCCTRGQFYTPLKCKIIGKLLESEKKIVFFKKEYKFSFNSNIKSIGTNN